MYRYAAPLLATIFAMVLSVASAADGDSNQVASSSLIDLTFVRIDGGNSKERIPRDKCYFKSYMEWGKFKAVEINTPGTECTTYQDIDCQILLRKGTESVPVSRRTTTILCKAAP